MSDDIATCDKCGGQRDVYRYDDEHVIVHHKCPADARTDDEKIAELIEDIKRRGREAILPYLPPHEHDPDWWMP